MNFEGLKTNVRKFLKNAGVKSVYLKNSIARLAKTAGANIARLSKTAGANIAGVAKTAGANIAGVAKTAGANIERFAKKNRSAVTAGLVIVVALSFCATFLLADNVMNFTINTEAAEASISVNGQATVNEDTASGYTNVEFSFELNDVTDDLDTVKNNLTVDITANGQSVSNPTVNVVETTSSTQGGSDTTGLTESEETEATGATDATEATTGLNDTNSTSPTSSTSQETTVETAPDDSDTTRESMTENAANVPTQSVPDADVIDNQNLAVVNNNLVGQLLNAIDIVGTDVTDEPQLHDYKVTVSFSVASGDATDMKYTINYAGLSKSGTIDADGGVASDEPVADPSIISVETTINSVSNNGKQYFSGTLTLNIATENMQDGYEIYVVSDSADQIEVNGGSATLSYGDGALVGNITVEIRDESGNVLASQVYSDCADWISDTNGPTIGDITVSLKDKDGNVKDGNVAINGDTIVVGFSVSDSGSGVNGVIVKDEEDNVYGANNATSVEFEVTGENTVELIEALTICATDNVGNSNSTKLNDISNISYNAAPVLDEITANYTYVKNGDTITYKFSVTDDDKVSVEELEVGNDTINDTIDSASIVKSDNGNEFTVTYTIPGGKYSDGTKVNVTKIVLKDDAGNSTTKTNLDANVTYLAPITEDFVTKYVTVKTEANSSNKDKNLICNGNTLTITISALVEKQNTNHTVEAQIVKVKYSVDKGNNWYEIKDDEKISPDTYTDMSKLKYEVTYKLKDAAGNETDEITLKIEDSGITYYAPLNKDTVIVGLESDNTNTSYAKNEDTLKLSAKMNESDHTLTISSTFNDLNVDNDFTIKSVRGDKDNFKISYSATVTDAAGQTYEISKTSDITYLAPITVNDAKFTSNAPNTGYAKLGSNLTFKATVNHDVTAKNVIATTDPTNSFTASSVNTSSANISFTFNGINGFTNGKNITPSFTLTDAAGNVLEYSKNTPNVKYDNVNPKVTIAPRFDGFLNDDFTCTATFSDENLYADGMTFNYTNENNQASRSAMNASDFADGTTTFSQPLTLTEEGTYKISASVKDKAGNSAANAGMTVTIDKTAPEITSVKINSDSIQVFKKGFVIEDYIDLNEEYINEIICKLSDGSGTSDWDISSSIETEGKKTITIIVTDMAGNTCTYTFEIYIDATAPAPVVKDVISSKEFTTEKLNSVNKELKLSIILEEQQIDNEEPDEFTSLKLLDEDGNVVYDFIKEEGLLASYEYDVTQYGKYSLVLEARDHAISNSGDDGNVIGPVTYEINFTKGAAFGNSVLSYVIISIIAVAAVAGIIFLILFLKKKNKKDDK